MPSNNEQLRTAGRGLQGRVSGKMGDIWWAFLLKGLFALGLGVSALIWPRLTLDLLVRLIGIYALLDGATGVISGIRAHDLQSYFMPALVSLVVGAVLLLWPGFTVNSLLIVLGVLAVLQGTSLFLSGRRAVDDDPNRSLLLTAGSVLAVIGLVLIIWPGAGAVTISWLVAALAFMIGTVLTFLALRLRKVKLRMDKLGNVPR